MRKNCLFIILIALLAVSQSSCSIQSRTMREPDYRLELKTSDFNISDQLLGEATETKVLGVDWERLFSKKTGELSGKSSVGGFRVPIIGIRLFSDGVDGYALHDLMDKNSGYDAVFYPQFERRTTRFLFLFKTTKVTVRARLAKFKI